VDTYGYRPLHRMASNNLAVGAEALLKAGADPRARCGTSPLGETPLDVARHSNAVAVIEVLQRYLRKGGTEGKGEGKGAK
jgi:ankyrin repeat protein